jgi:hypothetical protein
VGEVNSRFCKKLICIPNCAANGFTELELGRESRTNKCTGQILKYWYRIMCLEIEELIKLDHVFRNGRTNKSIL